MWLIHGSSYYQLVKPARYYYQIHVVSQRLHETALRVKHGSQEVGERHLHLFGRFQNEHPVTFYPGK